MASQVTDHGFCQVGEQLRDAIDKGADRVTWLDLVNDVNWKILFENVIVPKVHNIISAFLYSMERSSTFAYKLVSYSFMLTYVSWKKKKRRNYLKKCTYHASFLKQIT